jgi:nitroreductase
MAEFIDVLQQRRSVRRFEERPVAPETLTAVLEALRWSPSCFNEQPWELVWALRGSAGFDRIASVLVDANGWAKQAGMLLVIGARMRFSRNDKDNRHADFDAGSAWMALALQAERLGYRAHAMAGFDVEAAHDQLGFERGDVRPLAAIAVGCQADADALPEALREREKASDRKPVAEFARRLD